MYRFAVIPNKYKDNAVSVTEKIIKTLKEADNDVVVIDDLGKNGSLEGFDFAVTVGGDGTILNAAVPASYYKVPVIGVNLGNVGYLSSIEPDDIGLLTTVTENTPYQTRMMLEIEHRGKKYTALNDAVFSENRATRLISLYTSSDKCGICEYRCSALIFSTPTGSSGYNLSAKGPAADPLCECIIMTPVCPHLCPDSSIIFTKETVLKIRNTSTKDKNVILTLDGGLDLPVEIDEEITIKRSANEFRLIKFDNEPYPSDLMKKIYRRG